METKKFIPILLALIGLEVILSGCSCKREIEVKTYETGSFTDTRDGKTYSTIKIGEQWVMSENLAYKPEKGNFWAYDNDTNNVKLYGYLYDWETAKNVAPTGWHLPTDLDWKTLRKSLGGKRDVYKYLGGTMEEVFKQMAVGGCGFNALMAGIRWSDGNFKYQGEITHFWSSSKSKDGQCFYTLDAKIDGKPHGLLDSKEGTATFSSHQNHPTWGKSVRLFKD